MPGGSDHLFRSFPFRWVLRIALSLGRCMTMQDATFCFREDPLFEFCRPHFTLSCLCCTALSFGQSQSVMTQEVQQTKDIHLTYYKTLPTKAIPCLQMEPTFLEWLVALGAESEQSCHEDPNDKHLEDTIPVLPLSRWRREAFNHSWTARYCGSGYMWPLTWWRPSVYYLER